MFEQYAKMNEIKESSRNFMYLKRIRNKIYWFSKKEYVKYALK